MWIDSHCHLDGKAFQDDRAAAIERAKLAGVGHLIAIGTGDGPPDLEAAIRLATEYPETFSATVGVHPHDAAKATADTMPRLAELLEHPKCVALGEIGLDFHYDFSPRDVQERVFIEQMEIAAAARKPIVIHTREAWQDTTRLLREHWRKTGLGCLLHCFTGNVPQAREALNLGCHLAFGGVLTYPKAQDVRDAAAFAPADRILLETDAPYLSPVPHRGKRNEPAYVALTADRLAEVRGITLDQAEAETSANTVQFFGLSLSGER
ncbi:TatD family hydrolase [Bryobacterales bacterium F-183]|nr:TatD family hydrolase [Bryobacterales bacterium F-183]